MPRRAPRTTNALHALMGPQAPALREFLAVERFGLADGGKQKRDGRYPRLLIKHHS